MPRHVGDIGAAEFAIRETWRQFAPERAGFKREGLLRSWADVNGEHVDQVSVSLLPSDFTAVSVSG